MAYTLDYQSPFDKGSLVLSPGWSIAIGMILLALCRLISIFVYSIYTRSLESLSTKGFMVYPPFSSWSYSTGLYSC